MKRRSIGPSVSFFAFQDIITAVVGIFILITIILVLELTERVEAATSPPTANVAEIKSTIDLLTSEIQRLTQEHAKRIEAHADVSGVNKFNRGAKVEELTAGIQASTERLASIAEQLKVANRRLEEEVENESALLLASQQLEDERDLIARLNQKLADTERTINRLKSDDGLIYRDKTREGRFLCILSMDATGIELQDAGSRVIRNFRAGNWFDDFQRWLDQTDISSRHFLLLVRPSGATDFDRIHDLLDNRHCVYGFDVVAKDHDVQLSFQWEATP